MGLIILKWRLSRYLARFSAIILLIIVCFTAGCGPRWIYPNLNWLIPWYLEDYLPTTEEQEITLKADLEHIIYWHCHSELIRYADFLRTLALFFKKNKGIDTGLIEAQAEIIQQFYRDLILQIGPDLAELLRSSNVKQIDTLFLNLEKENQDLLQTHAKRSRQERSEHRQTRMEQLLTEWVGDLTAEQKQTIVVWSQEFDVSEATWVDNRRHVQDRFRKLIEQDRFDHDFTDKLTLMLTNIKELYTADYQVYSLQRQQLTFKLLATIGSIMTKKQRILLVSNLVELADDLDVLRCSEKG